MAHEQSSICSTGSELLQTGSRLTSRACSALAQLVVGLLPPAHHHLSVLPYMPSHCKSSYQDSLVTP